MTMPATRTRATVLLTKRSASDRPGPIEIEVLAQEAGLHPDLVRRLVRLGVVDPIAGTRSRPLFPRDAAARLARVARLRRDLGLNYAGALLASDLLARIEKLEERLRRYEPPNNRSR
jgi:chaperone modulatory protein CbpM